jgi:predicted TIM-barrel fold metal-dependent hydrolase
VTRLIYSGIYDELPGLKLVTHHMGGMIPYYAGKIDLGFSQIFFGATDRNPAAEQAGLKLKPVEYYKKLYADTALNGNIAASRCGHAFFGTDHCLFATDAPFDAEQGNFLIGGTIEAVGALEVGAKELGQIRAGNARALLRLP